LPNPRLHVSGTSRKSGAWPSLHLPSTGGNDCARDFDSHALTPEMRKQQNFKDREEWNLPLLNVFWREARLSAITAGSELLYVPPEPGQEYRHNNLLDPLWNLLDLTPKVDAIFITARVSVISRHTESDARITMFGITEKNRRASCTVWHQKLRHNEKGACLACRARRRLHVSRL